MDLVSRDLGDGGTSDHPLLSDLAFRYRSLVKFVFAFPSEWLSWQLLRIDFLSIL
jgi:hypothetical protein